MLRAGDRLQQPDGRAAVALAVRPYRDTHTITYNLTIPDLHTYYVLAGIAAVLVHNCGVEVAKSESSISISHADSGSGVIADLDESGSLTLMMENHPESGSPLRGKQMFADVMDHFGDRVKSIAGYWRYGDDLGAFNDAVANGKAWDLPLVVLGLAKGQPSTGSIV